MIAHMFYRYNGLRIFEGWSEAYGRARSRYAALSWTTAGRRVVVVVPPRAHLLLSRGTMLARWHHPPVHKRAAQSVRARFPVRTPRGHRPSEPRGDLQQSGGSGKG